MLDDHPTFHESHYLGEHSWVFLWDRIEPYLMWGSRRWGGLLFHCSLVLQPLGMEHAGCLLVTARLDGRPLESSRKPELSWKLEAAWFKDYLDTLSFRVDYVLSNPDLCILLTEQILYRSLGTCMWHITPSGCHTEWKWNHNWKVADKSPESSLFM